mgnify:FL=1
MKIIGLIFFLIIATAFWSCDDALLDEHEEDRYSEFISLDTIVVKDTIENYIEIVDTIIIGENDIRDTIRDTIFLDALRNFFEPTIVSEPNFTESYFTIIQNADSTVEIRKEDRWSNIGRNDFINASFLVDTSSLTPIINFSLNLIKDPSYHLLTDREEWISTFEIDADQIFPGSGIVLSDLQNTIPERYFNLVLIDKNLDTRIIVKDNALVTVDAYKFNESNDNGKYEVSFEIQALIFENDRINYQLSGNIVIEF